MGVIRMKILFLIVVLGVIQQATPQTTSDTMTMSWSMSPSWSNSNSISWSNSNSNSWTNSNSNSWTNSNSNSYSNSNSNSNSWTMSNSNSWSISNSNSNSYSTSLSYTNTVAFGFAQITGIGDACTNDASRICLYFTDPGFGYSSYNIYLTYNGTSTVLTTNSVPSAASPFIITSGLIPGQTYFLQVTGIKNGVEGPLSVPFSVRSDFNPIDSPPFDLTRVHNVRCGLVGNIYQCTYDTGSIQYIKTKLLLRCNSATTSLQSAAYTQTVVSTDTFLAIPVPSGCTCTSKLKSQYTDSGKTKYTKRSIIVA